MRIGSESELGRLSWKQWWLGLAVAGGLFSSNSAVRAVEFRASDVVASQGESVTMAIRVADFVSVQAFQFSLGWDPDVVSFGGAEQFAVPGLTASGLGHFAEQGRLTVVWDSTTVSGDTLADDSVLFAINWTVEGADGAESELAFRDDPTPRLVVQDLASAPFLAIPGTIRVGQPPTVEGAINFSTSEDNRSNPVDLRFADDTTPVEDLQIEIETSDPSLVSREGIELLGDGSVRELVVTPEPDQSGTVELTVRVTDAGGASTSAVLVLTVLSINDPPVAHADLVSVPEDTESVLLNVLVNDNSGPDSPEVLRVISVGPASEGGRVELVEGGIEYTPRPDFNGSETFEYRIADPGGVEAGAMVFVVVTPENDLPTARDDRIRIDEDAAELLLPVLENDDSLPDEGEVLTVIGLDISQVVGTVDLREGAIFYQPAPDFFGLEELIYTIGDGNGGMASARVTIEVVSKNDLPLARDDGLSVPEDAVDVFIGVLENDSVGADQGETLTLIEVEDPPSGGTVRIDGEGLRYSPAPNFFGLERFRYTVSDGNGGSASALVSVTVVNDRADAPVARTDRVQVEEDAQEQVIPVLADNGAGSDFDPDGDGLTVIGVTSPGSAGGTVLLGENGQTVVYTPQRDFVGEERFDYRVTDGVLEAVGTVVVTVFDANNDPPVARDDQFTIDEDSSEVRLAVLADNGAGEDRDPEGLPLEVGLVAERMPENGVARVADDEETILYSPAPNFIGVDTFGYFVSDGLVRSEATVVVTVINRDDDAPEARADQFVVSEDEEAVRLLVLADNGMGPDRDPEGGELFVVDVSPRAGSLLIGDVSVAADGKGLLYTPLPNFVGFEGFLYRVSDGVNESDGEVTVEVVNVDNDPPVAVNDRFDVPEGAVDVRLAVLDSPEPGTDFDPEGEALTVIRVSLGSLGGETRIDAEGRAVIYTPRPDFTGQEFFEYEISDGELTAVGRALVVVANEDEDLPVARDDLVVAQEDEPDQRIDVLADNGNGADFDPDGDALRLVGVEALAGARGSLVVAPAGDALIYNPLPDFSGREQFRYTVSDGTGEASAVVTIETRNVDNDPPLARSDQFLALEDDQTLVLRVLADNGMGPDIDPEGQPLRLLRVDESSPGSSRLELNEDASAVLYESLDGFFGIDRFTYTISDGTHEVNGTVVVVVTRRDNAVPEAHPDQFTVPEDMDGVRLDLLADNGAGPDRDPDGDPIRLLAVQGTGSRGGRMTLLDGGREVRYFSAPDFHGEEVFTYTLTDGILTATGTVTVTVTPVPDPPRLGAVTDVIIDQGEESVVITVTASDVDSDIEDLTLVASADNAVLLPDGAIGVFREGMGFQLRLAPAIGQAGQAEITLELSDGDLSEVASFQLTVREVVVLSGQAVTDYRRGGRVFVDVNRNGTREASEFGGEVDESGGFEFPVPLPVLDRDQNGVLTGEDGEVRMVEGVSRWTGAPSLFDLRAPLGRGGISVFSTLVVAVMRTMEVPNLVEAEARAAALIGLSELLSEPGVLLDLDPLLDPGIEDSVRRSVLAHYTALSMLVEEFAVLAAASVQQPVGQVADRVFEVLVSQETLPIADCRSMAALLAELQTQEGASLSEETVEFAGEVICDHLRRVLALTIQDLTLDAFLGELGRLRLAGRFGLQRDLAALAFSDAVSPEIRLGQVRDVRSEQIEAFPATNPLGPQGARGEFGFLLSDVRVRESGEALDRLAIVRRDGSEGVVEGAIVLVGLTASPIQDFVPTPLFFRFEDGQRFLSIDLEENPLVQNDRVLEGEESVELRLFVGNAADPGEVAEVSDRAVLHIIDDESGGVFGFSRSEFEVLEDRAVPSVFVERQGGTKGEARVLVDLLGGQGFGTAEEGVDFLETVVEAVIPDGSMLQAVRLPVVADFLVEPDESLSLRLRLAPGQAEELRIGSPSQANLRIVNDDFDRAPTISDPGDRTISEDTLLEVTVEIGDDQTALEDLQVSAESLQPDLLTLDGIVSSEGGLRQTLLLLPRFNQAGVVEVVIRVSDGLQTTEHVFAVTIRETNDLPELLAGGGEFATFVEGGGSVPVLDGVEIRDSDGQELTGAVVQFDDAYQQGSDRLVVDPLPLGVQAAFDEAAGRLTLSGRVSLEIYQAALRAVRFENLSDSPIPFPRRLSVVVDDGEDVSAALSSVVFVEPVNDPPALVGLEATELVFVENGEPIIVSDSILVLTVDDLLFTGATVSISDGLRSEDDFLIVGALPFGIDAHPFDPAVGELVLEGAASLGDYQTALRSVRFGNLSEAPLEGVRQIEFVIRDEGLESERVFRNVRVVGINDPPRLEFEPRIELRPGTQRRLNLGVSDPDSVPNALEVRAQLEEETVLVSEDIRVDRQGDDWFLEVTVPEDASSGSVAVSVLVRDGDLSTTERLEVVVAAGNSAPRVDGPERISMVEDSEQEFSVRIQDAESALEQLSIVVNREDFALFPRGSVGVSLSDTGITISLRPARDGFGEDTLTVTVSDGEFTVQELVRVAVEPENDLPTLSAVPDQFIDPMGSITFEVEVEDAETPAEFLLLGLRATLPNVADQVVFEIRGSGNRRIIVLSLEGDVAGVIPFEMVALDGDGGTVTQAFEVRIRESAIRPETLMIQRVEDGFLEIRWEGPGRLALGATVEGPFLPLNAAQSPFRIRAQEGMEFFRLVD